jgi:hypothetical protein
MFIKFFVVFIYLLSPFPVVATKGQPRSAKRGAVNSSPIMVSRVFGKAQDLVTKAVFGSEATTMKELFYECTDKNMAGEEVKMDSFKGNVLLVVNVASK